MTRFATRDDLAGLPVEVAPSLLGAVLETEVEGERVAVRLTDDEQLFFRFFTRIVRLFVRAIIQNEPRIGFLRIDHQ